MSVNHTATPATHLSDAQLRQVNNRDTAGRWKQRVHQEATVVVPVDMFDITDKAAAGPARSVPGREAWKDFTHAAEGELVCTERRFATGNSDRPTVEVRWYSWVEADEFGELGDDSWRRPGQVDYLVHTATRVRSFSDDGAVVDEQVVRSGPTGDVADSLSEAERQSAGLHADVAWGELVDLRDYR